MARLVVAIAAAFACAPFIVSAQTPEAVDSVLAVNNGDPVALNDWLERFYQTRGRLQITHGGELRVRGSLSGARWAASGYSDEAESHGWIRFRTVGVEVVGGGLRPFFGSGLLLGGGSSVTSSWSPLTASPSTAASAPDGAMVRVGSARHGVVLGHWGRSPFASWAGAYATINGIEVLFARPRSSKVASLGVRSGQQSGWSAELARAGGRRFFATRAWSDQHSVSAFRRPYLTGAARYQPVHVAFNRVASGVAVERRWRVLRASARLREIRDIDERSQELRGDFIGFRNFRDVRFTLSGYVIHDWRHSDANNVVTTLVDREHELRQVVRLSVRVPAGGGWSHVWRVGVSTRSARRGGDISQRLELDRGWFGGEASASLTTGLVELADPSWAASLSDLVALPDDRDGASTRLRLWLRAAGCRAEAIVSESAQGDRRLWMTLSLVG